MNSQTDLDRAYELLCQGKFADAQATCRRVLTATGNRDTNAWTMLGMILRARRRPLEAESAYRQAIALAPGNATAHHNLGALLAQLDRAEDAFEALERARALGIRARELSINRGRALLLMYRFDEAERAYADAVAMQPRDPEAQISLAQLRYMRGDSEFARDVAAALAAHPDDARLQMAYGDLMRRAGNLAAAESLLRDLIRRVGPLPEVRAALATVLHEEGRLREAELEALEAAAARPHDASLIENLVAIELGLGHPDEAIPFIRVQRARQPNEQRWIAYQATAARLQGDASYHELYDYARLVRVYDVEPPPGWASMEELNAALAKSLGARHRFASHPLDQSLRNGSQTARNLLTDSDPAIAAVLQAFERPIQRYREAMGMDAAHPLSLRNRGQAILAGCWSVQLRRAGFHVNHVHPEGWISSAYYVSVPAEVQDEKLKSGWIKFGEPRFAVPGAAPEHFVQPRPGRLVLFPSYMWHGTNPIHGAQTRMAIAFDAVPG